MMSGGNSLNFVSQNVFHEEEVIEREHDLSEYAEEDIEEEEEIDDEEDTHCHEIYDTDEYDEQIIESIFDLKEDPKTQEEYDCQIRKLIPIVYKDQDVDADSMIRKCPVQSELYIYLKQMYWYQKHNGAVTEEVNDAQEVVEDQNKLPLAAKTRSIMEIYARRALSREQTSDRPNQSSFDDEESIDDNGDETEENYDSESERDVDESVRSSDALKEYALRALGVSSGPEWEKATAINIHHDAISQVHKALSDHDICHNGHGRQDMLFRSHQFSGRSTLLHSDGSEKCVDEHDEFDPDEARKDERDSRLERGEDWIVKREIPGSTDVGEAGNAPHIQNGSFDQEEDEDETEYDEQVIESIFDLKEDPKTREEYDLQIRKLIPIVYKNQDVDADSMIRRCPVQSELYTYLKQMYWYQKHNGAVMDGTEEDDKSPEVKQREDGSPKAKKMTLMEIFVRRALLGESIHSDNHADENKVCSLSESIVDDFCEDADIVEEAYTHKYCGYRDQAGTVRNPDESNDSSKEIEVMEETEVEELVDDSGDEEDVEIVFDGSEREEIEEEYVEEIEETDTEYEEEIEESSTAFKETKDFLLRLQDDVKAFRLW